MTKVWSPKAMHSTRTFQAQHKMENSRWIWRTDGDMVINTMIKSGWFLFLFPKWTGFLWQLGLAGGNENSQRRADVLTLVSRHKTLFK